MSLTSVKMSEDVWLTCLTHALSTETEEIMGLLLGDIQHSKNGVTALIWGALPQPRSDRQKDRVETNPEQLTAASVEAEKMTAETGRTTRVIGWYHSHPHITVLPSHVDVRTQAMYQLLDSGFIGLIFSCFNEDQYKVGRIQVTAFQSLDGKQSNMLRTVPASPISKSSIIDLESSLSTDNSLTTSGSTRVEGLELDTGDSRAAVGISKGGGKSSALKGFFANADSNYSGRIGSNFPASNIETSIVDIDPMDMSDSMQEAMHRSNLEMSGAEYVRKEVPLHVLPTLSLLNLESPLKSFTDLQSVLYEEEKTAYHQAILQNMSLSPAINALQDRIKENEIRLSMLATEAKILEKESTRGVDLSSSSNSPRKVSSHGGGSPKDLYSPFESNNVRSVSGSSSRSRKGS
ncbi:hypothetical protein M8C21_009504 [Ambrosia artemisiifolia]|uniref:MPN domain-containing protein n=1 Tax=Ambrosia artemisiifolia TaxID=4212 RepID=A0AAD5BPU2_AMBAR|nr:hypothetical protein M8C21_009504 [Ambrosia artemisiifolia]